jgi:hypothetical protein
MRPDRPVLPSVPQLVIVFLSIYYEGYPPVHTCLDNHENISITHNTIFSMNVCIQR